ncbi:MAG: hypothetical protein OXH59_19320 [Rhodospirillaceae bacterium]|nr:hypothetical protein [Rhodospirillaceae bacterium]
MTRKLQARVSDPFAALMEETLRELMALETGQRPSDTQVVERALKLAAGFILDRPLYREPEPTKIERITMLADRARVVCDELQKAMDGGDADERTLHHLSILAQFYNAWLGMHLPGGEDNPLHYPMNDPRPPPLQVVT